MDGDGVEVVEEEREGGEEEEGVEEGAEVEMGEGGGEGHFEGGRVVELSDDVMVWMGVLVYRWKR